MIFSWALLISIIIIFGDCRCQNINFLSSTLLEKEWDDYKALLNNQFIEGKWVNGWKQSEFRPLYHHPCVWINPWFLKYIQNNCFDSPSNQGIQWVWQSRKQSVGMGRFSLSRLCKAMNGKNIMVVGDSLQEEMFFSFLSALRATFLVHRNCTTTSNRNSNYNNSCNVDEKRSFTRNRCDNYCVSKDMEHEACKLPETIDCGPYAPSFTISFARTDSLSLFSSGYHAHIGGRRVTNPWHKATSHHNSHVNNSNPHRHISPYHSSFNASDVAFQSQLDYWVHAIETNNISLLILNTGPHYTNGRNDLFVSVLNATLTYIFQRYPTISVIFRNSAHGHPNCEKQFHASPLTEQPDISSFGKYNWQNYSHLNTLAENLIIERFPQILQVNIFNSTVLRADSHPGFWSVTKSVDCLHYCIPGPIDQWTRFIYHAIVSIPTTNSNNANSMDTSYNIHDENDVVELDTYTSESALPPTTTSILKEGSVVKAHHRNAVYVIQNGTRRMFPNIDTFTHFGKSFNDVLSFTEWDMFAIPVGEPIDPI